MVKPLLNIRLAFQFISIFWLKRGNPCLEWTVVDYECLWLTALSNLIWISFQKEIPTNLQILPGQKMKMEEMLCLEKNRSPQLQRPALPPRPGFLQSPTPADMPEWVTLSSFQPVTQHTFVCASKRIVSRKITFDNIHMADSFVHFSLLSPL